MKKLLLTCCLITNSAMVQAVETITSFEKGQFRKMENLIKAGTSGNMLTVRIGEKNHGGTITISGPNGYHLQKSMDSQLISIDVTENVEKLMPGRYTYQVTAHVGKLRLVQDTMNNGRGEDNFTYAGIPVSYSGNFVVDSGSIKEFTQSQEGSNNAW